MGEISAGDPKLSRALAAIDGAILGQRINQLASIAHGSKVGEGGSRLGLSSAEPEARQQLAEWMMGAGMKIHEHPLGLVGSYPGSNTRLAPVSFGSHFDTVPSAGRYDGPAGTINAISVVDAFNQADLRFRRPLAVVAYTLEESSRFNAALIGSRAMTQGLTEAHLSLADSAGITLAQAIELLGFNPESTRIPHFKRKPHAFIEMHIEQGPYLADTGHDIGAVTAIAATDRQKIVLGKGPFPNVGLAEYTEGVRFTVNGQAGHSGGTPMGKEFRADGLVPTAHFLKAAASLYHGSLKGDVDLHIGTVDIDDGALNKIPGQTTTTIYLSGRDAQRVADARNSVTGTIDELNKQFSGADYPKFKGKAIDIEGLGFVDTVQGQLFDPEIVLPIYSLAGATILDIQGIVEEYRRERTVGTVGTFRQFAEGVIELGVDLRGVNRAARSQALGRINRRLVENSGRDRIQTSVTSLPSIKEPSIMNPELVALVEKSAKELGFNVARMPSGPGHDAQNFVEIGVSTGMIFIPSRNEGVSHNPKEYSTAKDLENGAKVLATVVANLAS